MTTAAGLAVLTTGLASSKAVNIIVVIEDRLKKKYDMYVISI